MFRLTYNMIFRTEVINRKMADFMQSGIKFPKIRNASIFRVKLTTYEAAQCIKQHGLSGCGTGQFEERLTFRNISPPIFIVGCGYCCQLLVGFLLQPLRWKRYVSPKRLSLSATQHYSPEDFESARVKPSIGKELTQNSIEGLRKTTKT